jgi:SAM-dependent methyltransferase
MRAAAEVCSTGPDLLEHAVCCACGDDHARPFITAEDDLTGRPGTFRFVRCESCGLVYQSPRIPVDRIIDYYGDEYIAHRRRRDWGALTPLFERAMNKLDEDKDRIVSRYVRLTPSSHVLDVGCAAATFLRRMRTRYGASAAGVDFKDLSALPSLAGIEFHCGLFYDLSIEDRRFDLVTMWHFLEHDYDPLRSLQTARRVLRDDGYAIVEVPRLDSRTFRWFGRRWPGLQAPQHTVLFDRASLLRMVRQAGLEVVDYLPYGAFPAYFYLFTGVAFALLQGRGLNLDRAILPYFVGQLLLSPALLFERRLNLAMQTVVCRRRS